MMSLFHFTSLPHLEEIIRAGAIQTTESNIGAPWQDPIYPYGTHAGPPVVHLMDSPNPFEYDHGLTGATYDKRQVRFEVSIPGIPWGAWEWTQRMSPRWRGILERQAGEGSSAHWYIHPAPIRPRRWVSVSILDSDETPVPDAYKAHLGPADEHGYRPLREGLIEAIRLAPGESVRPPR